MNNIETLLADFTDYEAAIFYSYKLPEYLTSTQVKIKNYIIKTRGLDEKKIEELIKHKPVIDKSDNKIHCPKCNTKRLIKTRLKWVIPAFRIGYEDEAAMWKEISSGEATFKDKIECFVCGHVLFDPNNEKRPFYKRVLDIFLDKPLPI